MGNIFNNRPMVDFALNYLKSGKSVIPVGTSKVPLVAWQKYQQELPTEEEVKTWWTTWPDANVGIITGKISNLTVVDVEKGGAIDLPDTLTIETGGGGKHYYFNYMAGVGNKTRILPLVDIRSEGGYVCAPPSLHASGQRYKILKEAPVVDFPIFALPSADSGRKWDEVTSGVPQGQRNDSAAGMIGKILRVHPEHEWESVCWPLFKGWNSKNTPPLSEKELRITFNSIAKRELSSKGRRERTGPSLEEKEKNVNFISYTELLERSIVDLDNTKPEDIISFGYDWLDDKLTGLFPGEMVIVGGETGCLHPDTKIFDPVAKTRFTVKERHEQGKKFFVYALNENNKPVIAEACPPKKFTKTKMYELSNGKRKIVVTGKHRIFDGKNYITVDSLRASSSILLPTISESYLSMFCRGVPRLKKITLDFQFYCRRVCRFCDEQLLRAVNIFSSIFPLRACVHEHSYAYFGKDDQENKQEYIHFYPFGDHLSKQDFSSPLNKTPSVLQKFRSLANNALQSFLLPPLLSKFYSYLFRFYTVLGMFVSVFLSTAYSVSRDFLHFSFFDYTKWAVRQQEDEVYYDFTVPQHENYYANGLFHHNTGKTVFCTNIIYKASLDHKCIVFALEDRLTDYGIKAIYFELGKVRKKYLGPEAKNYPWNSYRRNEITDPEYKCLREEAVENLKNGNIHFADISVQMDIDLLEKLIKDKKEDGFDLFLIDHLHYFDLHRADLTKADYIEKVMVKLKTILNHTGIKLIMVVHYKKLQGKKPALDSFKDSISIVQNANYVINIWRNRSINADQYKTTFQIPKSRNPNGEGTIEVEFDPAISDYKKVENWWYGTEQEFSNIAGGELWDSIPEEDGK